MEMGNEEIKSSYRNAKHPKRQISILADLNCCSREEIEKIVQETDKGDPISDIMNHLYRRMDQLDSEIHEREIEYKKTVIAIETLSKIQ